MLPVVLNGCETWTIHIDLEKRIDSHDDRRLHRVVGYRKDDHTSNQRLLDETESDGTNLLQSP